MSAYLAAATGFTAATLTAITATELMKHKQGRYNTNDLPTSGNLITPGSGAVGLKFGKLGGDGFKGQLDLPLAVSNHTNKAYAFDHGAYEPIGQNHELKASTGKFSVFA